MPTPSVHVDWTNDADFADAGEDVTTRALADADLTAERGRNQGVSQSPPLANALRFALANASGDYSPSNAASPLYPNVDVGRLARWRETHAGTPYDVVHGYLDGVDPDPDYGRESVAFTALSQLARLVRKDGFSSALLTNVRTDQALGAIFDAAGIPAGQRAFDVGQTTLLFFHIRPEDELFDLALKIWASEGTGARLYDGADGKTYFKNRYAQLTEARSTTVQATYRDTATEPWYAEWEPDAGEQHVVNVCSASWRRRAVDAADGVLWTFGAAVTLAAGEARPFQVRPATDDPIASVVAAASGTDYVVTAGALASVADDRTSGPFVTRTLTAGAAGATVTGLQVRGKLARVTATAQVTNTIDTSASRAKYGPKPYALNVLPEVDYLVLQDFCNAVVGQNQTPRPMRTIAVPLVTATHITSTLPREIGDRVRVINARSAFDREMFVEYRRDERARGAPPVVFLGCQAVVDGATGGFAFWDGGLWDTATWAY